MIDHTGILTAVAGFGLNDANLRLADRELDPVSWQWLLAEATSHGITGHLVAALENGALPANSTQWFESLNHHETAVGSDLLRERLLIETLTIFGAAEIRMRVLKGPAVAHIVYPNPAQRSFRDVDVLVPGRDYDRAIDVLLAAGGRLRYAEPRPGFNRRFGKGACVTTPSGLELDVHRTLISGPFGLAFEPGELFETNTRFRLGGQAVEALDPEVQFVHACIHAQLGDRPPRLVPLRDVAQILLHSSIDIARVRELCRRWRCGIVVQEAIRSAWAVFTIERPNGLDTWVREYEPSNFERWALGSYFGSRPSYARQAVGGLWAIPSVPRKFAYARALLMPTGSYIRERDGSYLRRLGRGFHVFAGWRPTRRRRKSTSPR